MTIDDKFIIQTAIAGGSAILVAVLGWSIKRNISAHDDIVQERGVRVERKVDLLVETVTEMKDGIGQMKLDNAHDHAKVLERLATVETKVENMRSPWQRSEPDTQTQKRA